MNKKPPRTERAPDPRLAELTPEQIDGILTDSAHNKLKLAVAECLFTDGYGKTMWSLTHHLAMVVCNHFKNSSLTPGLDMEDTWVETHKDIRDAIGDSIDAAHKKWLERIPLTKKQIEAVDYCANNTKENNQKTNERWVCHPAVADAIRKATNKKPTRSPKRTTKKK